ncbi:MAG: AmmeMemoRadiSam system protein B [Candidatus Cloacimonetes bacterium]|nr:AmmeMemoRadiSam system protein B [Candidatus Cloacimonadota bacterium]
MNRENEIRQSCVAGSFYTADSTSLRKQIEDFMTEIPESKYKPDDILGIIVPHAGYIYSGKTAAYGYKTISKKDFNTAVILAPSHRVGGFMFSVGNYSFYETPLGQVKVNKDIVSEIQQIYKLPFYKNVHNSEHSLEVQLPFLQVIKPECSIIPIVYGQQDLENSFFLAEILYKILQDRLQDFVIIASTDLSHYYDAKIAETMDSLLADCIVELNYNKLYDLAQQGKIEACGLEGIIVLLRLAELLGYKSASNLNYAHSGMNSGDNSQVVGYLSSAIYI